MAKTKEELQENAQLVRIHEANCKIEHPTLLELSFREAVMKQIGVSYGLKQMRGVSIAPPSQSTARNPQPAKRS